MNSNVQRRRARSEICLTQQRVHTRLRPPANAQQQRYIANNPSARVQVQNPNIVLGAQDNDEIIEDVPLTPEEVELMYNIQYRTIEWVNSVRRHGYRRQDTESIEYEQAMLHYERTGRHYGTQNLAYAAAPLPGYYPNANENHDETIRNDRAMNKMEKTDVEGTRGFHNGSTNESFQNPNPVGAIQYCTSKAEGDRSGTTMAVTGSIDDRKCSENAEIKSKERTKTTTGTTGGTTDKRLTVKNLKQSAEPDNSALGGKQITIANKIVAQETKENPGSKEHSNKHGDGAPPVRENGKKPVSQSPSYEGILTRKRLRDQVQATTEVKKKVRVDEQKQEGGRMLLRSGVQNTDVVEQPFSGVQTRSKKKSSAGCLGKKKCD